MKPSGFSLLSSLLAATALSFVVLSVSPSPTLANDTALIGVSGTATPLEGEHSAIRMVREHVHIDLFATYYDTVVDFEFSNESHRLVSVPMGFPESGYAGTYSNKFQQRLLRKSAFERFSTTVDGKAVTVRRSLAKLNGGDYSAYWVKMVTFAPQQKRKIQVRYRSPLGSVAIGGMNRLVRYNFTGRNWKGRVAESRLTLTFREPGNYIIQGTASNKPITLTAVGTTLSYTWRDWEAQTRFALTYGSAPEGWLALDRGKESSVTPGVTGQIQSLTVPGTSSNHYDFLPPFLIRDGILYLSLRQWHMADVFFGGTPYSFSGEKRFAIAFDEKAKSVSLRLKENHFEFQAGSHTVRINGKEETIQGTPFVLAGGFGKGMPTLYVPATPIMQTLKRQVAVKAASHRVAVSLTSGRKAPSAPIDVPPVTSTMPVTTTVRQER